MPGGLPTLIRVTNPDFSGVGELSGVGFSFLPPDNCRYICIPGAQLAILRVRTLMGL